VLRRKEPINGFAEKDRVESMIVVRLLKASQILIPIVEDDCRIKMLLILLIC
jgi:hypothetical protein